MKLRIEGSQGKERRSSIEVKERKGRGMSR